MNTVDITKLSPAALLEFAKKMQETNNRIVAEKASRISFKVSLKGAISVYGLGRFPTTLHPSQWDSLFASEAGLKAFLEANRANCDKASELYENIATEGKAKGLKDQKLDDWVKEQIEAKTKVLN